MVSCPRPSELRAVIVGGRTDCSDGGFTWCLLFLFVELASHLAQTIEVAESSVRDVAHFSEAQG
jgi:hypothetical protein